jgi:ABC-2 type transport system ATP-binding protein
MIQARDLSKRYGDKLAVDSLTFTVQPGRVTGFLGPNGAGKSTTMRMIMGLDTPSAGSVTVNGRPYRELAKPLAEVGALLEAKAIHTSRSARNHLRALAATHGISDRRVIEVIDMVGLRDVASKRAGGFSLGMGQRLGIASALLGDPATVILDEPVNGLDPEGIRWVRDLLRSLAADGRTVFLSSHLMSEMAVTADHVIVIGQGRLIADMPIGDLIESASVNQVHVRTPHAARLRDALVGPDVTISSSQNDVLEVHGIGVERIGHIALEQGIVLYELTPKLASLEEAYMDMTRDSVEYHASAAARDRNAA